MKQLLELYNDILVNGETRQDRTGTGTLSVFGRTLRFDLREGFPILTTRKAFIKSVVSELLWFLEGSHNEHRLAEIKHDKTYDALSDKEKRTIWTDNYNKQGVALGYKDGELGPLGYSQWINWNGINQLDNVITLINKEPHSRRMVVSAWNVNDLEKMTLPPCHYCYQFYVSGKNDEYLSLMFQMRSVDSVCGLPSNIASYTLLLNIIARITNKIPKEVVCNLGDVHIYMNHVEGVKEQLKRTPYKLPKLIMPDVDYTSIGNFSKSVKTSDFKLENYMFNEPIKFIMSA